MAKKAHPKVGKVSRAAPVTAPAVKAVPVILPPRRVKAVAGVCLGCGYWDRVSATTAAAPVGRCRVASPVLVTSTASAATAGWPITRADDWCGAWVAAS